jgi:hypothetical protein
VARSCECSETAGGLTPASLCVVPTGLAEILALYPGLTPWANLCRPVNGAWQLL